MIGYLAIVERRKGLKRKLTTEDLLGIFQENLLLRPHVITYWEDHFERRWIDVPEEIPVNAIIEMLDLADQDAEDGIITSSKRHMNKKALKRLWVIFRRDIDSVLTRKDLLRKFPDLLTIETDYQEEILSDDEKKAIRLFNRLENNQVSAGEILKNAAFVLDHAPDNDIKKAVRIILHEEGIKV